MQGRGTTEGEEKVAREWERETRRNFGVGETRGHMFEEEGGQHSQMLPR